MFSKLKEMALGFVADVAFFFGAVMADGFEHRMQQIAEEEEAKMNEAEAEANKLPDLKVN